MRPHLPWLSKNCLALSAAAILSAGLVAACSSSSSSSSSSAGSTATSSSPSTKAPITIGASLSLTGDFSADGQAFERGYELWASDVNAKGGLLGRQVTLKILNDNSSPTQVQTNYQTLFAQDKVDLAFGPFSSLLTTPSASVAARYGYALVEGAGGAPSVFESPANVSAHNVFDVSLPIEDELIPFVNWVASLPPSQRPKTAAYPMADDPFADPPVQLAQQKLQALGVKTVYSKIFPEEESSYKPAADQVAATGAQAVLLGSTDVPTVSAFMQAFEQQHYNPKMFICAAGPDQGAAFTSAVGKGNATGMMVPNGWYPGYANPASQAMVNEYVAKYGGSTVRRQRRRGRGLLGGPGDGPGGDRDRRHRQREDHHLPAQRRDAQHRAGTGEVRQLRQERQRRRVHLPVAEGGHRVQPGASGQRGRLGGDPQPQAELD